MYSKTQITTYSFEGGCDVDRLLIRDKGNNRLYWAFEMKNVLLAGAARQGVR